MNIINAHSIIAREPDHFPDPSDDSDRKEGLDRLEDWFKIRPKDWPFME